MCFLRCVFLGGNSEGVVERCSFWIDVMLMLCLFGAGNHKLAEGPPSMGPWSEKPYESKGFGGSLSKCKSEWNTLFSSLLPDAVNHFLTSITS